MVQVQEYKGKNKTSYFLYEYIRDEKTRKFKKVYKGKTDKATYLEYLKSKTTKHKYCKHCGKMFKWAIPDYVDSDKFDTCKCY